MMSYGLFVTPDGGGGGEECSGPRHFVLLVLFHFSFGGCYSMALRYGQNLQVQNEQYERHTNKTKIGHEISKQQKMKRSTQKLIERPKK